MSILDLHTFTSWKVKRAENSLFFPNIGVPYDYADVLINNKNFYYTEMYPSPIHVHFIRQSSRSIVQIYLYDYDYDFLTVYNTVKAVQIIPTCILFFLFFSCRHILRAKFYL